ncbi:MAG: RtcB family protein [Hyphomicrobiales bacterium]|nr:RtcB family protein [Hyphomicrobiales bacterium]
MTGKTLLDMGYEPGAWFKPAIDAARAAAAKGATTEQIIAVIDSHKPALAAPMRAPGDLAYHMNIRAETSEEAENVAAVERHMVELMRVPVVVAGAVMPDACSAGSALGTIPVGGVVASKGIHPGMHSADICCSMALTIFDGDIAPARMLDAGMSLSHFGGGGRPRGAQIAPDDAILTRFAGNVFLKDRVSDAIEHHATQGDGNHFFYVGRVASSGKLALVTHYGSRKPGAMLYKAGMAAAEKNTRRVSPETPRHNAWLDPESNDGRAYWEALQVIRAWTKSSHYAIHDRIAASLGLRVSDRFWNEHNFAFRKSDGLYYHGKGATPSWNGFADDDSGLTLIPMNMAEPILIAKHRDAENGLGFAPHGAGRNFSRSAYMRRNGARTKAEIVAEQTAGIDARFFCGVPDVSELPGAYKPAATVRAQIEEFGLAHVVDTIEPIGSIMAGDWQTQAPWRKTKR